MSTKSALPAFRRGGTMYIPLNGKKGAGLVACVSVRDYPRVRNYRWHLSTASRTGRYAQANIRRGKRWTTVWMHCLILPGVEEVDHRDGNGLDNRRRNLRDGSARKNKQNRFVQRNNSSGYRGVHFMKSTQAWSARIGDGKRGTRTYLGASFATPEEAAHAYDQIARKRFGRFARLNFPRRGEFAARR